MRIQKRLYEGVPARFHPSPYGNRVILGITYLLRSPLAHQRLGSRRDDYSMICSTRNFS